MKRSYKSKGKEREYTHLSVARMKMGLGGTVNTLENTTMHCTWTKKRTHGSMPPLCAYDIVVVLQMDFVLLLRSINDWTHESQCGPEPVNHRPRGKKASLNRTSLSLRAQGMSLTKCKKRPTKRKTFRHNFSILELDIRIERYLTLFTKDSIYC